MEKLFNLQIDTEMNSERGIGRKIFPVSKEIDSALVRSYHDFATCFDEKTAWLIEIKLTNNSALIGVDMIGSCRPVSSYYSIHNGRLYVEWGQIDPKSSEAKLHDRMRNDPIYINRKTKGAVTRSGHICQIKLPECDSTVVTVALFDSLPAKNKRLVTPQDVEYKMVRTLVANNVIPVTSDGFPILFT